MSTPCTIWWGDQAHREDYDGQPRHILPLLADMARLKRRSAAAFYRKLHDEWGFGLDNAGDADFTYKLNRAWTKVEVRSMDARGPASVDLLQYVDRRGEAPDSDAEDFEMLLAARSGRDSKTKKKRRFCGLCKPHKRGGKKPTKPKYRRT